MDSDSIFSKDKFDEDTLTSHIRPQRLDDYIGQHKVKENLRIFVQAAKQRGQSLDHCLFYGPPGLGKTTLAYIIASELGVNINSTSGPVIEKAGDLAAILTNLQEGDVLFIDGNPPPALQRGGDSLPGYGGLQAGHYNRSGTCGENN